MSKGSCEPEPPLRGSIREGPRPRSWDSTLTERRVLGSEGAVRDFRAGQAPRRGEQTVTQRAFAGSILVRRTTRRGILGIRRSSES